jgi:hypothetical protein
MARIVEEEKRQNLVVTIISFVGIVFFVLCLFPLVSDSTIDLHNTQRIIPFSLTTRVAVVATCFGLACNYIYDISLPERLTYPRIILLLSLLVPNTVILLVSLTGLVPERVSICFKFAGDVLFSCGIHAYLASEVVSKRLLLLIALGTTWVSLWHLYYTLKVFVVSPIPNPVLYLIQVTFWLLYITIIALFVNDMKILEKRRKMFALVYIVAVPMLAVTSMVGYVVLGGLHEGMYTEDYILIIRSLFAAITISVTSRMAQYDATIAMVMTICLLT